MDRLASALPDPQLEELCNYKRRLLLQEDFSLSDCDSVLFKPASTLYTCHCGNNSTDWWLFSNFLWWIEQSPQYTSLRNAPFPILYTTLRYQYANSSHVNRPHSGCQTLSPFALSLQGCLNELTTTMGVDDDALRIIGSK